VNHPVALVLVASVQVNVPSIEQWLQLIILIVIKNRVGKNDQWKRKIFDLDVGFLGEQRTETSAFGELLRRNHARSIWTIDHQ
jgi:hypothetical protein